MLDQQNDIQYLSLGGQILRLSKTGDKLSLDRFQHSTGAFEPAGEMYTGRELFEAQVLTKEEAFAFIQPSK